MNWNQAKTILIVLFLAVNAFLLVTLVQVWPDGSAPSETTAQQLVQVLRQHQIALSADEIMRQNTFVPTYRISTVLQEQEEFLRHFEESLEKAGNDASFYAVTFQDSYVEIQPRTAMRPFSQNESADPTAACKKILHSLGLGALDFSVVSSETTGAVTTATLCPIYEKKVFLKPTLTISYSQDAFLKLKGDWIFQPPKEEKTKLETDLPSVLVAFLQRQESHQSLSLTVESIRLVYTLPESQSGNAGVQAVPTYALQASDGMTYLYDARSHPESGAVFLGNAPYPVPDF